MAGVGAADYIRDSEDADYAGAFDRMQRYLEFSDNGVRYYGGFSFARNPAHDDSWRCFGRQYFVLPRFELVKTVEGTFFVCNLPGRIDECERRSILSELESVVFSNAAADSPNGVPKLVSEKDFPEKPRWEQMVRTALAACSEKRYEKIVLARRTVLGFSGSLNPLSVLQKLNQRALNSFKFCFQPECEQAFIGASPELLYYRNGRRLQSEAVAGTCVRGRTPEEDRCYGEALLKSEKDLREHRYVIDCIKDAFAPLVHPRQNCNNTSVSLLKLAGIQHLITRFDFEIKENVPDAELLRALHPTAAVGGYPRHRTIGEIGRLEGFDRGWYAAPVGWVARDAAEFVVAIRSGLVKENTIHLFSGAGIVNGSDPNSEWNEMNSKIEMFLRALN